MNRDSASMVFALVVVMALPLTGCWWHTESATDRVALAFRVANSDMPITGEFRKDLGVPTGLVSRDQIAEWLFQEAARLDAKNSAAYYNMAIFYLDDRNCKLARESLRHHLQLIPGEEDGASLLTVIEEEGCFAGGLFLGGKAEAERRQIIAENPELASRWGTTSN